ncbi:MAG TPA: T9SS type A sorting domain-containing protein [Lentimicrobium sp.]|nr:T9SS type A sorting domain-containing protein [Lentimicrobium sp.]
MKSIFTILLSLFTLISSAQDYQLFNVNSKKVYRTQEVLSKSYSLTFDSASINSSATILYPYRKLDIQETPPTLCHPWGGGCYARNSATWMGESVIQKPNGDYTFITQSNDSLNFDFTLAPIEANIFYQDENQRFSLSVSAIPMDTFHFAGVIDTVKRFPISHTDLEGNIINSALNNYEIIIGKHLGLINFFRIDSFPQLLTPLQLLGNENPPAGIYHLTNAMIYDHQPGDEIQYYKYSHNAQWPQLNSRQYIKHTFLTRNETEDSLIYEIKVKSFYVDSTMVSFDTISVSYEKNEEVAILPFDFNHSYGQYYNTEFSVEDHLGDLNWTYKTDDHYSLDYCEDDGLWCSSDDHDALSNSYVLGLGLYKTLYEDLPSYNYNGMEVIYYRKNGIEHGNEAIVGINYLQNETITNIIPNPAEEKFRIEGNFINGCIVRINDFNGRTVLQVDKYLKNQPIDISNLNSGIYLINVVDSTNVYTGKLLIK